MSDRDYRDMIAGFGLTLIGGAAAIYAASEYSMGTVRRMGPGMVPVSLGVILAGFGLTIAVPALFRRGTAIDLKLRPLAVLSVAIVMFALLIETAGLVPAVFLTTVLSTFAEKEVPLINGVLLGAAMAALTWSIFILGLGLPIPTFDWPF